MCQGFDVTQARKASKQLGRIALVLLVAAVASFIVPVAVFAMTVGDEGVDIGDGVVKVDAPPDRTWGIYFNDADNTGYGESCSVRDDAGRRIGIRDPGPTVTFSETEMLDHVFVTPADGTFTIDCNANGATVRVGPVGNLPSVLVGTGVAALLGLLGLVLGSFWLIRRTSTIPDRLA